MVDGIIFHHIGITLYETIVSFLLVILISILMAVLLWTFRYLSEILDPYMVVLNSLPKSALAPLLIVWLGANRTTIIVAGMSVAIFGSILSLYTSFISVDPGKDKSDIHASRHKIPCSYKSCSACLSSGYHQHYEVNIGLLSCGRDHRRISSSQKRSGLFDHLLKPGVQNGSPADEYLSPVPDGQCFCMH